MFKNHHNIGMCAVFAKFFHHSDFVGDCSIDFPLVGLQIPVYDRSIFSSKFRSDTCFLIVLYIYYQNYVIMN